MRIKLPIAQIICLIVVILSLFLPYKEYDYYTGGMFGSTLTEENVREAGIKFIEAYIPSVLMLLALIPLVIKRNRAMAIISLILSSLNLLYMPVLAFALTFELFSPRRNVTVELGYMIAVVASLTFFVFAIIELRRAIRYFRTIKPKPQADLLDDL